MQFSSHLQLVHFNFAKCPFADRSKFLVSDVIRNVTQNKTKIGRNKPSNFTNFAPFTCEVNLKCQTSGGSLTWTTICYTVAGDGTTLPCCCDNTLIQKLPHRKGRRKTQNKKNRNPEIFTRNTMSTYVYILKGSLIFLRTRHCIDCPLGAENKT